jgi:hypothetical protein
MRVSRNGSAPVYGGCLLTHACTDVGPFAIDEVRPSGADPARETVTAIAARWGFMNPGRFAVLYRQTSGQSPHTALRDDPAGARLSPTRPVQSDESMALLLRTLWAYRGFGGDLASTAAALAVHRSTVRYRLHRIRELTGLDPQDPRSMEALRASANPRRSG